MQLPIGHAMLPCALSATPKPQKLQHPAGSTVEFGVQLGGRAEGLEDPGIPPRLAWIWDHQVRLCVLYADLAAEKQ